MSAISGSCCRRRAGTRVCSGATRKAAFAARLAALLTAPDERRRLGALNRERAAEFSLEAMVARYERLLRDLIAAG